MMLLWLAIPTGIVLVSCLPFLIAGVWFYFEAQAKVGCERLDIFAPVPSPDGRWVAVMHTDVCTDGAFTTAVSDSVHLISVDQPQREGDVLGKDDDGRPEYLPVITWIGPSTLRLTVKSYSAIGLYRPEFETIKVDLRSEHDDPASRAATLKRLGLPPDLQAATIASNLNIGVAGIVPATQREARTMTIPGERRDPDVERKVGYPTWPEGKPFPLTPLEAWYVLQGWAVKPKARLTLDQALDLPGKVEFGDGYVWLWQS